MTDGMLTQDEIDALLAINSDDDEDEEIAATTLDEPEVSDYLSLIEEDTIGEIGNISFGSSATTLSTLLNQKVEITTPKVSVVSKSSLYNGFASNDVRVKVTYVEGFHGENLFVIKANDAAIIADIMLGGNGLDPSTNLDDIHLSAIQEAMNQMMGAAATSMSTVFNKLVNISPPIIEYSEPYDDIEEEFFVRVNFQLKVGSLIDSKIMQLIPFPFAHEMVEELLNGSHAEEEEKQKQMPAVEVKQDPAQEYTEKRVEKDKSKSQYIGAPVDKENVKIQQATFSDFAPVDLNQGEQRNLDLLLDIPLKLLSN